MKQIALSMMMAALTLAQTPDPEKKVTFEVASIRAAKQDGDHDSDVDKGFFRTHNLTLKQLIAVAYGLDARYVVGGPNSLDSYSYDINAKIPGEFSQQTRDKVPLMIQSLLADRFQLALHRETRQMSGYALAVTKKGPKMARATSTENGANLHSTGTHLTAENATMEAFTRHLSRNRDIGQLVIDKTGLTGRFNFELDWMPGRPEAKLDPSDDRAPIFTALEEQLGLKLEYAKVPILAVVVDRAEKPGDN